MPTPSRSLFTQELPPAAPYGWRVRAVQILNQFLCRTWYGCRLVGPCTVPAVGPVILAANHTCTADPLMLSAACSRRVMSFLIAREYANLPFFGYFVRLTGCIPVRRDGRDVSATKQALRRLRQGYALGIFIEGRITPPDQTPVPKDGVALLALRSRATVIPVHISGTLYRDGITAGFLAHHRTRLRFGAPVDLSDLADRPGREAIAEATRRIYHRICALGQE